MTAVVYIITQDIGKKAYMNKKELIEIQDYGIEIGSHTLTHPDLSTISPSSAKEEITASKTTLEKLLGEKILSFCYPSGKFNESVETMVKEAGYFFAVTTKTQITTFEDPFALKRDRMNHSTSISLYLH